MEEPNALAEAEPNALEEVGVEEVEQNACDGGDVDVVGCNRQTVLVYKRSPSQLYTLHLQLCPRLRTAECKLQLSRSAQP